MPGCGSSFGVCAIRVTKVDAAGNVVAGNYSFVSDSPVSVSVNPNIEAGNEFSSRNGCGCSITRFKSPDTFNWWELTFVKGELEPALEALLLNGTTISDSGEVVGLAFPSSLACDEDEPAVGFEFWTQNIVGSGQDGTFPWYHWLFPKTVWQLGDNTFEEGILQPTLTGFSRTNTNWGDGPYGDGPPESVDAREGAYWKTDVDPPSASCEAGAVTSTS